MSQSVKAQNIVLKLAKNNDGKLEDVVVVGVVDTVLRFRGTFFKVAYTDMADFQYHPYPDSKFVAKFETAFSGMNCISMRGANQTTNSPISIYPWKKMILQIST
jgi:hypothetical protein